MGMFLIAVLLLAFPVLAISALVDISRQPSLAFTRVGRSKGATFLLVVLSGGVGGLYWWLAVRRSVVRHRQAARDAQVAAARAW